MSSEKKYLVKDVNLVQLTEWLNSFYGVKKSGEEFTVSDCQGYTKRKLVPAYLGGHEIEISLDRVRGVRSYSVIDNNEDK